jgi:acyl-CoA oxidase
MSAGLKEVAEQCIRLWILSTLERERWGDFETRKVIQEKVLELCDWLTPRSVSLIDSFAAPSGIIGSPFADEEGEGMRKYMNLIFTAKNTFKRVDWFETIVQLRNNP